MSYDLNNYVTDASRTAATPEHLNSKKEIRILLTDLLRVMETGISADSIKRSLFYKEDYIKNINRFIQHQKDNLSLTKDVLLEKVDHLTLDQIDLIHVALGLVSEAKEMLEAVILSAIAKSPLPLDNLKEELGDAMWYLALGARTIHKDFSEITEANIAKLKVRYPEKFNMYNAVNRNLTHEEKVLSCSKQ